MSVATEPVTYNAGKPWTDFVGKVGRHWLAACLLGIVVAAGLQLFSDAPAFRLLERQGADAATKYAVRHADDWARADRPRVVLLTVDDHTLRQWGRSTGLDARGEIARVIGLMRESKAQAVVVDMTFMRESDAQSAEALRWAIAKPGRPVVLAAALGPLSSGDRALRHFYDWQLEVAGGRSHVHFGHPLVGPPEPDGAVRAIRRAVCVYREGQWTTLPSIAHLTFALSIGSEPSQDNCKPNAEPAPEPIFFMLPPSAAQAAEWPATRWFASVSAANAPLLREEDLAGAIVIIGQHHAQVSEDRHWTPLADMPGVLLHANALAGMLHVGLPEKPKWLSKLWLKFLIIISVATVSLLYWVPHDTFLAQRISIQNEEAAPTLNDLWFLLDLALFIAVMFLAFGAAVYLAIRVGASELLQGAVLGSLVPAFAVVFEATLEIGRPLMRWIHYATDLLIRLPSRLRRGVGTAVVALGLAAAPAVAASGDPAGFLQIARGDPADVRVTKDGRELSGGQVYFCFQMTQCMFFDRARRWRRWSYTPHRTGR